LTIHARDPYGSDYVTLLTAADGQGNTLQVKTSEKIRSTLSLPTGNFSFAYRLTAPALTAEGTVEEQALLGYIDSEGKYVPFSSFAEHPLTSGGTAGADTLVFYGKGAGHGVGFSSQGAEQLAAKGVKYPDLIAFYFPGTEIANLLNGF
jgi:SpoIID/LytB domain protein